MPSAFGLRWRCILELDASSKNTENLLRSGELVLNLPSPAQVDAVDRLARLTGSNPTLAAKPMRNYTHEKHKWELSGLTPVASESVKPPRALECPIQMEAVLAQTTPFMANDAQWWIGIKVFEVCVKSVSMTAQRHFDSSGFSSESKQRPPDHKRPSRLAKWSNRLLAGVDNS